MSEVWILYFFTRVDELKSLLKFFALFGGMAALGVCFFTALAASDDGRGAWDAVKKLRPGRIAFLIGTAVILNAATPTQRDLAIIVGGKLAVDAAQSTTARKLLDLVNATIDSELDKALGKRTKEQKQ